MTTSCTNQDHPYYDEISKFDSFEKVENFFRNENGKRMKFVSLGEMLDFVCGAGMNFCSWRMDSKKMAEFVKFWMDVQKPRIEYEKIPDEKFPSVYSIREKSREYSYEFNRFPERQKVELPFINYSCCPRDKSHRGTIKDISGRVRCEHIERKKFKPSFIEFWSRADKFSMMEINVYNLREPYDPSYEDDSGETQFPQPEYKNYLNELDLFKEENFTEEIIEPCYAVISDQGNYLPLQTVLDRISVGDGRGFVSFPFSGFTLANYVEAWHNQKGEKEFFKRNGQKDFYRESPNFEFFSSED